MAKKNIEATPEHKAMVLRMLQSAAERISIAELKRSIEQQRKILLLQSTKAQRAHIQRSIDVLVAVYEKRKHETEARS